MSELSPHLVEWLVVLTTVALFWTAETVFPARPVIERLRHDARNLVIALINSVVIGVASAAFLVAVASATAARQWGLLPLAGISRLPLVIGSFIILDLLMYWWHRMNHSIGILWRFHRMHHSDRSVDVTTATRFHVGEIAMSFVLRLAFIPLFGIPLEAVLLYDAVQLPVICFHHANIMLPPGLDRALRYLIVTPGMHQVHHSRVPRETDSNFSSVFSVWDRMFGSFCAVDRPGDIRFGLDGYDQSHAQTIAGMLSTPFSHGPERGQ